MAAFTRSRSLLSFYFNETSLLRRGLRGKPPEKAKNLEQKLREREMRSDPLHLGSVNIGFPFSKTDDKLQYLKEFRKNKNKPATFLGRIQEISLTEVKTEWENSLGIEQIKNVAEHYAIYNDLFGGGYFYPVNPLKITFNNENYLTPIYFGNHVKPNEMDAAPEVSFVSDSDSLWSLILTNMDCHFKDDDSEYLHWFVGNIRSNDVSSGEIICDYMPPFPTKGTGYHRIVFVLYKQTKRINFDAIKRTSPCLCLDARTFRTREFYKQYENDLTPAGLAFSQCDWDESVPSFFRNVLQMREPNFEYKHPKQYIKKQTWNPHKVAFDTYLDKYRDPKEIAQEVLLLRLRDRNPFENDKERPEFPLILNRPSRDTATWIKKQRRQRLLGHAKFRDLYD